MTYHQVLTTLCCHHSHQISTCLTPYGLGNLSLHAPLLDTIWHDSAAQTPHTALLPKQCFWP